MANTPGPVPVCRTISEKSPRKARTDAPVWTHKRRASSVPLPSFFRGASPCRPAARVRGESSSVRNDRSAAHDRAAGRGGAFT